MRVTEKAALLQASIPISKPTFDPRTVLRNYQETPINKLDIHKFSIAFRESL
jgi:hypothetical protein